MSQVQHARPNNSILIARQRFPLTPRFEFVIVEDTWAGEGSKKYLRHQTKSPGIPCFLWPLQQFGYKTEHFGGICKHLEFDANVSTASATLWSSNLSFSMVAFKFVLV